MRLCRHLTFSGMAKDILHWSSLFRLSWIKKQNSCLLYRTAMFAFLIRKQQASGDDNSHQDIIESRHWTPISVIGNNSCYLRWRWKVILSGGCDLSRDLLPTHSIYLNLPCETTLAKSVTPKQFRCQLPWAEQIISSGLVFVSDTVIQFSSMIHYQVQRLLVARYLLSSALPCRCFSKPVTVPK